MRPGPRTGEEQGASPDPAPTDARARLALLLLSGAFFFCVLGSYYVLRPLRDAFGVSTGVKDLKWLYTGTFVAMLVASPCFSALVTRFPRRRVVPWVYHACAIQLGVFAWLLAPGEGGLRANVANVFFVWVSVYNLFVVSVFWSFMADLWRADESERWFGPIAACGSAGGLIGALLTEKLVVRLEPHGMLWISIALLEGAVCCAYLLRRRAPAPEAPRAPVRPGAGFAAGARLVLRSRYLLAICGFMLLTTVCASIASYARSALVAVASEEEVERMQLFGRMDQLTNLGILLLQAFAARPLIRRAGVGATLAILPATYALGFLALALGPALGVIAAFEAVRRTVGFGLATPTTQVLYTLVAPDEKYAAKNFVETAVWRGGDLVGVHVADLVAAAGTRLALLAAAALPVTAVWAGLGVLLGRMRARRLEVVGMTQQAADR